MGAGVCSQDFVLHIRGRIAVRVLLPSSFSFFVSELGLDGIYLDPQGSSYCPLWVPVRAESSSLVSLGSGWRVFARQFNLCKGDRACCHFDGVDTFSIRAFDADGNRLEPCWEDSSNGGSGGSVAASSSGGSSSSTPSASLLAFSAGLLVGGVSPLVLSRTLM